MWYLEIEDNGRLQARLKLPAAGLSVGPGSDCDLQAPGHTGKLRLSPARQVVLAEQGGETTELAPGQAVEAGRLTLRVSQNERLFSPGAAAGLTRLLSYDKSTGAVTLARPVLRVETGPDAPLDVEIDRDAFLVGGDSDCDLMLTDEFVSGRHLRLEKEGDSFWVADLQSTNGTFIDNRRIERAELAAGAKINLGKTTLAISEKSEAERLTPIVQDRYQGMIGRSRAMREVFALVEKIAPTDATVLVTGPTGSGKEMIARALHARSPRASGPFVAVNCGSIVRELVAAELFGHVKGAFTGAESDRAGLFEMADGGVLFLDEIAELPLDLQPNLLRVLEQRVVRRVGDRRDRPVDVRVIAATHRDLHEEVGAGRFREDLFFRLDTLPIELPPLSSRGEDIPLLARHFVERETAKRPGGPLRLTDDALAKLAGHSWPGNVRELANVITRAVIVAGEKSELTAADLSWRTPPSEGTPAATLADAERELIVRTLSECPSRKEAAARLGIAPSTLYDKIKKYELE